MKYLKNFPFVGISRRFATDVIDKTGVPIGTGKSGQPMKPVKHGLISMWQVSRYGGLDALELKHTSPPLLKRPGDLLIKVKTASVNPLDVYMLGGYGKVVLSSLQKIEEFCESLGSNQDSKPEVPFVPGRDFSGEVVAKGNSVSDKFMIGDEVYGVIPPHMSGSHAEQITIPENFVLRKPKNLSFHEAGGALYTAVTAWSALKVTGDLFILSPKNKNVLVLGASGGVGSAAVQMLNNWGAQVVATCRTDAIPMVSTLGAQTVIDYTTPNAIQEMSKAGKYDLILDASGESNSASFTPMLKDWSNAKYISLRAPVLQNTDQYGLLQGTIRNVNDFIMSNLNSGAPSKGSSVRWGFFMPIPAGIQEVGQMLASRKILTKIDSVFPFKGIPEAFKKVQDGHLRGKVIVELAP